MKNSFVLSVLVGVTFLSFSLCAFSEAPKYEVRTVLKAGGDGGWDYLCADTASRRLYVSHTSEVLVFNMDTLAQVGKLDGFGFVHGIVILPSGKKGFISDGKKDEVDVFDPATLQITARIKTDANPNSMVYNKATDSLFVGHKPTKSMDVIDPNSEQILEKIKLHGVPEFPVTEGRFVYVNIDDTGEIARINAATRTVEQYWKLDGCERPSGLAIDMKRQRLFSTCRNGVVAVVNSVSGTVVAEVPSGMKPDAARFDPQRGLAFASNGDGTLTVIGRHKGDKYYVMQVVRTAVSARTMALDAKRHTVFLSAADMVHPSATGRATPLAGTFRILVVDSTQ